MYIRYPWSPTSPYNLDNFWKNKKSASGHIYITKIGGTLSTLCPKPDSIGGGEDFS